MRPKIRLLALRAIGAAVSVYRDAALRLIQVVTLHSLGAPCGARVWSRNTTIAASANRP
jgi:hypothetical protein